MELIIFIITIIILYQSYMINNYRKQAERNEERLKYKDSEIELIRHNLNTVNTKYYDLVNSKECKNCIHNK